MTLNPVNGDRSKVMIEAVWGLGEPLVAGEATPDRFLVDKVTGEVVRREIAEKPTRAVRDPEMGHGVVLAEVDGEDRSAPSLAPDEIVELVRVARLDRLQQMKAMRYERLPDLEDQSLIESHRGTSSGYQMIEDFSRMVLIMYETYQFHFELLNIGYAAYLTFFQFCKTAFPDISDQTISRMVGGLHVDLYRPDDELKRLAKEAVRQGIGDTVKAAGSAAELFAELRQNGGATWVEDWERTADPWFLIATDPGHPGGYSHYGTWASEPDIPLAAVKEYIAALEEGKEIDRPTEQVLAERDRITAEYRELLDPDDQAPSTRCSPSRGSSSCSSRSTSSTSSTGCGRRSGPSPMSSPARSRRWGRSTTRGTCSSCAGPRSRRRSMTW